MVDPDENWQPDRRADWFVAASIGVAIVICLVAFVWVFVQLDPFLDDFIPGNAAPTPTPSEPLPGDGPDA